MRWTAILMVLTVSIAACAENEEAEEDLVIPDCPLDLSGTEAIIYKYTEWDTSGLEHVYGDFEIAPQGLEGTDWPITAGERYILRGSYAWSGYEGVMIGLTGNFDRYECDAELDGESGTFEIAVEISSVLNPQESLILGVTDPDDPDTLTGIGIIEVP